MCGVIGHIWQIFFMSYTFTRTHLCQEYQSRVATEMFDNMYADLSPELLLQRQTMRTSSLGQDPSQIDATNEVRQSN